MPEPLYQDPKDTLPLNSDEDLFKDFKDRIPEPTPTSAQIESQPSSHPLPTLRITDQTNQQSLQHRSSSMEAPQRKPGEPHQDTGFENNMPDFQKRPVNGHKPVSSSQELEPKLGNSKDALEAYDWNELEEKFHREMGQCDNLEKDIQNEFDDMLEVSLVLLCSC